MMLLCGGVRREAIRSGRRLSPTAHLLRIQAREHGCSAYLGVGHTHRGEADADQKAWTRAAYGYGPRPNRTFRWGYQYSHFFYALEPHPPFRMIATSGEFCVASEQDERDCESIQFVSGLAPYELGATTTSYEPAALVLAYGANDCEARMGVFSLERIWRMLTPLEPAAGPCFRLPD